MNRRAAVTVATVLGLGCHAAFLAGVGAMIVSLHEGLQTGGGTLHGPLAWTADAALALQFPLLHSFFLSRRGRRALARVAPTPVGAHLVPTTYALVASLQLVAVFLLWSPSGTVWWRAQGAARIASTAAFAGAWLLLLRAMSDAGLALQTGTLGWVSVVRGRTPDYGPLRTGGLQRLCRQPVYVAFALTLWTPPTWTPDGLVLAVLWTGYCLVGPRHKEARYRRAYGAAFDAYRARTPYWLPWPRPGGVYPSGPAPTP